jgi:transposase
VGRFVRRWRATGNVSPEKFGGYKGYVLEGHEQQIEQWIAERPDITLAELRALLTKRRIVVGKSSIARFLDHLDLSLKKTLHAAEQDRSDVAAARRTWRRRQPELDPRRLAFIDETSATTNMTRRYGRRKRGERLVCKVPHGHWKTSTLRPCVTIVSPHLSCWTAQ